MKKWREKFYQKYVTSHISSERGELSLKEIESQFFIWDKYYGGLLPENKEASILEVGCGSGELIYWMGKSGYTNVYGIDVSGEQIEKAKKNGFKNVELADFNEFLKDKEGVYDCILAIDVIEHFDKDEVIDVLEILYKSLKPGGRLIIQTPNAESLFGSRYRYYDFTHGLSFTPSSLKQLFKVIGFKETNFYPTGPVVHGLKSLVRWLLWKIFVLFIKFYLIVETGSGRGIFTQNMVVVAKK